ncbi:hypothetical protein F0562_019476 [Nyssa sinensis]|uniref:Uncharacterized protein n=1 Tax=Nyssa sinensis TaxID=561372 RepID=A0A5J5BSE6_9ASTE|nr:hypothetical protein F0562_019476 [Nyssa sinensis]
MGSGWSLSWTLRLRSLRLSRSIELELLVRIVSVFGGEVGNPRTIVGARGMEVQQGKKAAAIGATVVAAIGAAIAAPTMAVVDWP